MFRTRPTRTWLTILGMGVGTGAVLFLIGLGYGFQHLILSNIVSSDTLLSLTISSTQPDVIVINDNALTEMKEIDGVKDISPIVSYPAQIAMGDLIGNIILKGIDENYLKYEGVNIKNGRAAEKGKKEIVVSEAVVMLFGVESNNQIIGERTGIQISGTIGEASAGSEEFVQFDDKYEIVGVVGDVESVFIYFPLADLQKKVNIFEYESAKVRVNKESSIISVSGVLIDKGFQVTSLSETVSQANQIFRGIQFALGFFGAIALFVAAIGMVNTMTVTLLERTNEIGIMRATGASKKDILIIFMSEATVMGFLGGISGLVMGVLGGLLFNLVINVIAGAFGGKAISLFFYPAWFIITLIVVSTFVGLAAGFFPGRKAAKLDPLDALRYK
ncbi:ABC transporter permease [Patescibacteria group bacterium]|nr:ABC transporter permease [Patescibacteria group bacterium]